MNAWYVDPAALCQNNAAYAKNPDSSYDLELTVEISNVEITQIAGVGPLKAQFFGLGAGYSYGWLD